MKKFISLVLALVMALSLTTVAWGVQDPCTTSPCTHEAAIGTAHYDTLAEAVAVGGTVTLLKDVTLTGSITITTGMDVTIEGTGKTISGACDIFRVTGGKLTLGAGLNVLSTTDCAVFFPEDSNGTLISSANLSASDVFATIQGNGNATSAETTITINGGSVTSAIAAAIYHPQAGTLTISGGTLTGNTGVYVKSGTVNITGGTISGNGAADPYAYNGNGCELTGDALVIDNCNYPNDPPVVSVTGGTFTSANAAPVASYSDKGAGTTDPGPVTGFISGGTFDEAVPAALLASGLTQTTDGVVVSEGGTALSTQYDLVTTDISKTKTEGVTVNTYVAKAPRDADKSGKIEADELGNVQYVEFSNMIGQAFVQVASAGKADYTVYYTGTESVFGYFAAVASPSYWGNGVAFYNFGEACGQYDDTPVIGAQYYTFQGNLYMADPTYLSETNLMVGTTLTPVTLVAAADDVNWVTHVAKFTYDKNYVITAVVCAECGTPAVIYPNYASVPKAEIKAENVYGPINTDDYYCWLAGPGAVVDTETDKDDKVTSADTFDAGIAMYVGMSIMAAAGGAVVIGKKKD